MLSHIGNSEPRQASIRSRGLFEHALIRLEGEDMAGRVLEIALRAYRSVCFDFYPSIAV